MGGTKDGGRAVSENRDEGTGTEVSFILFYLLMCIDRYGTVRNEMKM